MSPQDIVFAITGWWMLPAAVTLYAIGYYVSRTRALTPTGYYGGIGNAVVSLVYFGVASIITMAAWLVYLIVVAASGGF